MNPIAVAQMNNKIDSLVKTHIKAVNELNDQLVIDIQTVMTCINNKINDEVRSTPVKRKSQELEENYDSIQEPSEFEKRALEMYEQQRTPVKSKPVQDKLPQGQHTCCHKSRAGDICGKPAKKCGITGKYAGQPLCPKHLADGKFRCKEVVQDKNGAKKKCSRFAANQAEGVRHICKNCEKRLNGESNSNSNTDEVTTESEDFLAGNVEPKIAKKVNIQPESADNTDEQNKTKEQEKKEKKEKKEQEKKEKKEQEKKEKKEQEKKEKKEQEKKEKKEKEMQKKIAEEKELNARIEEEERKIEEFYKMKKRVAALKRMRECALETNRKKVVKQIVESDSESVSEDSEESESVETGESGETEETKGTESTEDMVVDSGEREEGEEEEEEDEEEEDIEEYSDLEDEEEDNDYGNGEMETPMIPDFLKKRV